jgi:hypothetical protein
VDRGGFRRRDVQVILFPEPLLFTGPTDSPNLIPLQAQDFGAGFSYYLPDPAIYAVLYQCFYILGNFSNAAPIIVMQPRSQTNETTNYGTTGLQDN